MISNVSNHATLLLRQCYGLAYSRPQGCTGSGDKCNYAAYVIEASMFGSSFITLPRFGVVRGISNP